MTQEVRDGKKGSAYSAIRKLGNRPGETGRPDFLIPAYVEQQLTPQQSAEKLADHFSQISETVEPLEVEKFHPAPRETIKEGIISDRKPMVNHHHVNRKFLKLKKPHSCVPGGVPRILIKENPYEFSKPAMRIFNRIVQTAEWPTQWTKEHITVIPKSKTDPPQTEDDL